MQPRASDGGARQSVIFVNLFFLHTNEIKRSTAAAKKRYFIFNWCVKGTRWGVCVYLSSMTLKVKTARKNILLMDS